MDLQNKFYFYKRNMFWVCWISMIWSIRLKFHILNFQNSRIHSQMTKKNYESLLVYSLLLKQGTTKRIHNDAYFEWKKLKILPRNTFCTLKKCRLMEELKKGYFGRNVAIMTFRCTFFLFCSLKYKNSSISIGTKNLYNNNTACS